MTQLLQLEQRQLPLTASSLASLPRFLPLQTSQGNLQKTGLGSSAALITSLVGALLCYFGAVKLNYRGQPSDPADLQLVHNLAQFCHCLAQGKVGSGFDVSAAVYGSQKYVRFSKEIIAPLLTKVIPEVIHTHHLRLIAMNSVQLT